MHKFHIVACFAGLFAVQSFAQPRDLFAEFEAEATQSSEAVVSSSSAIVSSSSVKESSSSVVSSSSVAPLSSSEVVSSSSDPAAPADSSTPAVADTTAPAVADTTAPADTTVADSAAVDSAKQMTPEEAFAAEMRRRSEENRISDSLAALSSSSSEQPAPDISSSSMSRRDLLGPVKVSRVHGIDEMKGRYKSPRKALFMSLVVPGSGQLYVGGSNFTNIRGGVYLALEAALWGSWYYFSVYKYDQQVSKYKTFAKKHFSIGRYERGMRDLYNADAVNYESEFRRRYLGTRESFCEAIFGNASMHGCYDRDKLYHNDVEYVNDFVKNPKTLLSEKHKVKFDNKSEVYQLIADDAYVLGWDDVEDRTVATALGLEDPESATVALGESENLKEYRSLRSKATDYADMQAWFFGGLILNHIVSAIDAALTANSHNKSLYEEDLSWYDHLHFDSGVSFVGGFGVNVQASWGF